MSEALEATLEAPTTYVGSIVVLSLRAEVEPPPELVGTIESGNVTIVQWNSLEW